MLYLVASLVILAFMAGLALFRIVPAASQAVATSRAVLKSMSDPQLDDARREQLVQKAALSLLGSFVSITVRGVLALALSYAVMFAADRGGLVPTDTVVSFLASPLVIVVTSVALTAGWWIWKKR
jgi:hypothetical protein